MTTRDATLRVEMRIGFSGTRLGMNDKQRAEFAELITLYRPIEFHHGDCVGADAEAHAIVRAQLGSRCRIISHPCKNRMMRAFCVAEETRSAKAPIDRNHDIVNETDHLIAAPATMIEVVRGSGTWATIRYAEKVAERRSYGINKVFPLDS